MKLAFFSLVFLFSINVSAQNLVPNGNFEKLRNLPVKPNPKNSYRYEPLSGYKPYLSNIDSWFAATKATPDLRVYDKSKYLKCNKIHPDCDKPKSGEISAGIISYQKNKSFPIFREYIEVKLKEKLKVGKTVNVEFWVIKEREAKIVSNNIGCYLSVNRVTAEVNDNLKLKPQINHDTIINETEPKWVKITGQIEIDKAYEYLLIGNFFSNEDTEIKDYKNYTGNAYIPPYAYYLVDDVRLWYEGTSPEAMPQTTSILTKDTLIENALVEFEYDSAVIKLGSTSNLDRLITSIMNSPAQYKIKIIGHTDNTGTADYNLNLSSRRAKSILEYMLNKGISSKYLSFKGLGETQPVVENTTEENKLKNRRVEIILKHIE